MPRPDEWKQIEASLTARRTVNPIRQIVDQLKVEPNPQKDMISLALGDPTLFGNFKTTELAIAEIHKKLASYQANGYPPSVGNFHKHDREFHILGYSDARDAIAKYYHTDEAPLTANVKSKL
jgi:tyrosine aminotransferase